jgi:hypothetical protein
MSCTSLVWEADILKIIVLPLHTLPTTAHKQHFANSEFAKGLQSFAVDNLLLKTTITISFLYSLFFTKLFISVFIIVSLFWFVKKFFN